MDFLDQVKDKMELDAQTQRNVLTTGTVVFLLGAVAATLLRRKKIPVRDALSEVQEKGTQLVRDLARRAPRIGKPK